VAVSAAPAPRVPFFIGAHAVGSVAQADLPALRRWPQVLRIGAGRVEMALPAGELEAAFAEINAALRAQGLIRAWRDEPFAVVDQATLEPLTRIERAASRFWGTLTFGAHANGVVRAADGGIAWMWIAQRAFDKATDPGAYDNLVGAGVTAGQTPREALERECWEEAGLAAAWLADGQAVIEPGSVLVLERAIPEGWQHEHLHAFDLWLPGDFTPRNMDGEVAGFTRMTVADAVALAGSGRMTADAALVTFDFALRHGLPLPEPARQAALAARYSSP
jgi:8-oxo-dGTP pyrophosphatase MutT (NUDIX family)